MADDENPARDVQHRLERDRLLLQAPDVQQRMTDLVIDTAPISPQEFAEFIRSETSRWANVVKDAGIPQQ